MRSLNWDMEVNSLIVFKETSEILRLGYIKHGRAQIIFLNWLILHWNGLIKINFSFYQLPSTYSNTPSPFPKTTWWAEQLPDVLMLSCGTWCSTLLHWWPHWITQIQLHFSFVWLITPGRYFHIPYIPLVMYFHFYFGQMCLNQPKGVEDQRSGWYTLLTATNYSGSLESARSPDQFWHSSPLNYEY